MVESKNFNIVLGLNGQFPTVVGTLSTTDLIKEYKDAVIGQKKFLTWDTGCFEMKNVLGVFS